MNAAVHRRAALAAIAGAAASWTSASRAQPSGVSRLVVGFAPGGTADGLARVLAPLLAKPGQTWIVENKPGASGQIAAETVKQANPDGNTLLLTPSSILSLVPHLYRKPMYDSLRDFAPIGAVCDHSFGFAVPASSTATSIAKFVQAAKAASGPQTFATPGTGTAPHFLGSLLARETGAPMLHVPYKGVAPGLQDLIAGQVACTFNPLPALLEFHKAGRIRILAVTNPTRVASLPDVPTFSEAGLAALELVEWYGLFAGARVPASVVARLSSELKLAIAKPDMAAAAARLEVAPRVAEPAELARMLAADHKRWEGLVRTTGITLDT